MFPASRLKIQDPDSGKMRSFISENLAFDSDQFSNQRNWVGPKNSVILREITDPKLMASLGKSFPVITSCIEVCIFFLDNDNLVDERNTRIKKTILPSGSYSSRKAIR
jgi:hypothetical protein